jgi:hypothetical protein
MFSRFGLHTLRVVAIVVEMKFVILEVSPEFPYEAVTFGGCGATADDVVATDAHALLLGRKQKSPFGVIEQLKNGMSLKRFCLDGHKGSILGLHRKDVSVGQRIFDELVDVFVFLDLSDEASPLWQHFLDYGATTLRLES